MSDFRRPFGPDELPDASSGEASSDLARSLATGRELESIAERSGTRMPEGFADRVMAAVRAEPVPQPAIAAGRALRAGRVGGFLASVRDAWRVAFSAGRPALARAQAFALVALTVVALGALGGGAAVGAAQLLRDRSPEPSPVLPSPAPSVAPTPTLAPEPSPTPSPTLTPSPSPTPTGTDDDDETPEPTETDEADEPTDDNSGRGGGDDSGSDDSGHGSDA